MINKTLTLDEYKAKIAELKDIARSALAGISEGEIVLACSQWRDAEDTHSNGACYRPFVDFSELLKHISKYKKLNETSEHSNDPVDNRLYWDICKYKLKCNNMLSQFECKLDANGAILTIEPLSYCMEGAECEKCSDHHDCSKLKQLFEWNLLNVPHNVVLPYKTGDVLYVDASPFGKPYYVVYGKPHTYLHPRMGYEKYYHYCLYYSKDRQGLWIDDLANSYFGDHIPMYNSPLGIVSLAKNCDEPLISKASELLKENPALWDDWMEIWNSQRNPDNGGMEQWIFQ